MPKLILTTIFILMWAGLSHSAIYYVSNSGNDNNSGLSSSLPWQTIAKVNSNMTSFNPGDQILFQRGSTFTGTLLITKSGAAGNYLTFGSYGSGALAEITGKKNITGWIPYSGNIYKAYVGDTISAVYVSEKLMTIARYPNTGFLTTDNSFGNTGFFDAGLTQPPGYWVGANCRIRTANWSYEIKTVSAFLAGAVTFSSPTIYTGFSNYGFYFDNKLNLLDTEKEWFYDYNSGYLYLYAPGGVNPNSLNVSAVTLKYGISNVLNTHYFKIQDLKISGFRDNGIEFYYGTNKTVQGCYISQTGLFAIRSNGVNNLIENNTLEDNLNTGIGGVITNGSIKNNVINRTCLVPGYGQSGTGYRAIDGSNFLSSTIELNNIDSSGYVGISVAKNNIVKNNVINFSLLVLNDGGAIDVTDCDSLTILNNIISNSIGNFESSSNPVSYASGIYINNAVMKNTTIQGNVISYCRYMGMHIDHKNTPVNNKIIGNVCYNNYSAQILFTDFSAVVFIPSYNTIVTGNIFYSLSSSQNCMEQRAHTASGFSDFGLFDSNYYCNPYSEYLIKRSNLYPPYGVNLYTLPGWQTGFGKDLHSKSLPFSFSQYTVTDTVSNNLITNSKFVSDINNWSTWPYGSTISHVIQPLLDTGSMRIRWNGQGYYESLTLSNGFPITKGYNYLVSLNAVGNQSGTFNVWGRSSFDNTFSTFPQTYLAYENYRKSYSFSFKADTTDPAAYISVGMKLPDTLVYVDNINVYRVLVSKIDSTEMSKIFINENNYPSSFPLGGIAYKDLNGNPVTGSITLQPFTSRILVNENYTNSLKNLQLKVLLQGFYNPYLNSSRKDTIRVYLRNSSPPYIIIDSAKSVCDSLGNLSLDFNNAENSTFYYLSLKHRNSIETWTASPVSFYSNLLGYDFTASANRAYGNNLTLKGTKYCVYSGDVNQDGSVDLSDVSFTENAASNYVTGYVKEDCNGDGIVDLSDISYVDNGASLFVISETP